MGYNYKNYNKDNCNHTENKQYPENCYVIKNHNHEFVTSTDYEEDDEGVVHNHSIAGATGHPIPIQGGTSHIHKVAEYTDTFDDHFHGVCDFTEPAIYLSGGKHIHLIKGRTRVADEHQHDYYFFTLIEDPTNVPEDNNGKSKTCDSENYV